MRLTTILLLAGCLQVSASGFGQKINISGKDIPLEKVFSMIRNQTGYVFFYDYAIFKGAKTVSIDIRQGTVEDVLNTVLKGQGLEYEISDKTISITKKQLLPGPGDEKPVAPPADVPEIAGVIKSEESGAPLAGATVTILKLKKIGLSNEKGEFVFHKVPNGKYQVEISFVGYEKISTELVVSNNKATLDIALRKSTTKLDEAVVIPYGVTTERLNTGDVTKVTAKEIEEQPVSNSLAALEGRVPGLQITQATGLPGGSFKVEIRGQGSINAGTDPFYVIDGVPYESELPTTGTFTGTLLNGNLGNGNPLNFINPYDIESIEVLKDADATAIYGSRAANGAILITTKKGQAGKTKFDINLNSGITSPTRDLKFLNTQQYLAMRHEAFNNDGETPQVTDYDINGTWDTTRYTDWSKVFLNSHPVYSDGEISVSGGSTNIQYLIGGGYNYQTSGMPAVGAGAGADKRGSVHFNLNTLSADKRFKLSLTSSYISDKNTVQTVDFSSYRYVLAPDAPALFNPDGSLNWAPIAPGLEGTWNNPYSGLYGTNKATSSNLVSNIMLEYNLLPGLNIKTNLGYTNTQVNEVVTSPASAVDPFFQDVSGAAQFQTMGSSSWIIEPQAEYQIHLSRGKLSALIGSSFHENNSNAETQLANGFLSDALLDDLAAAQKVINYSGNSQYKYSAIFGRLGYNWMDKYLLNLNVRRDGSSRFGPGKQFGNFGSIGAAWIFSKEKFIEDNIPVLSFGKLRGSYGTTGNDQIGDYQFLDLYTTTRYPYENLQALYPRTLFNTDLEWEVDKKLEGGIELGFLRDRLILQASVYRNRSGNQLLSGQLSAVTGYTIIPYNSPALMQNSGEEYVVRTVNIKTKNFTWTSSFNLSFSRNKLVAFPATGTYTAAAYKVGQPVNSFLTYHMIGVNDTTGLYQFADVKGNPTYSPNYPTDYYERISLAPKYFGGFENSFNYKGFSIDFLFQFVKQTGLNLFGQLQGMPGTFSYNIPVSFLDAWQKPGDKKTYQQFSQDYGLSPANQLSYAQASDFAYSDASFIRLKNLAVSWQMPSSWLNRIHLGSCRFYVNAENLLTITHYNGTDPESQSLNSVPKRVLTGGFQVTF